MKSQFPPRYTSTAKFLHWLVAVAATAQLTLGLCMIQISATPPGPRAWWFNLHKSIGITLGVIILLRLAWRLTHPAPPLPEFIPAWQRTTAKLVHGALYVCMVVIPLSGYLGSSFTRYPILYFGHALPRWAAESPALKELCSRVHLTAVVVFITLIAIHVGKVLKHLIVDRDEVFQRMGWTVRSRERVRAEAIATAAPGLLPGNASRDRSE